jgi:endonuclease YncB( thermonuclease family)
MKYEGTVVKVVDGDTVHIEISHQFFDVTLTKNVDVRLVGIDAPETKGKEKPLGLKAKAYLTQLIENKKVSVEIEGTDVYDRYLGTVFLDEVNVNQKLIDEKLVEVYTPQNHNNGVLDI